MKRLLSFAVSILVLGLAAAAQAGTLTSPTLFTGVDQNVCVVVNVGTKPIEVTVELIAFDSANNNSQTCTLAPNDVENSCQAFANDMGFCRVTAAGSDAKLRKSVRAVMMNRQIQAPFEIYDSVEAR
jgi:hypothetical protein